MRLTTIRNSRRRVQRLLREPRHKCPLCERKATLAETEFGNPITPPGRAPLLQRRIESSLP
jgi:hypothetical protein